MTRVVAMADTHGFHDGLVVPDGEVLIHAGDMCRAGSLEELEVARNWLAALPHRHKIIVAGNHDRAFEDHPEAARQLFRDFIYLQDEACVVEGIRIYGSPWTPAFFDWAFMLPRGRKIAEKWALIPEGTELLITHGPPRGIGDKGLLTMKAGCADLLRRVQEIRPALHLFGHIHEGRGRYEVDGTTYINVSTDECLSPVTVIEYPLSG